MIAAAICTASATAPAMAQQNGLVNVTITNVSILNNLLNDTQIAALNNVSVPITVQVPIGVAAMSAAPCVAVLGQPAATLNARQLPVRRRLRRS